MLVKALVKAMKENSCKKKAGPKSHAWQGLSTQEPLKAGQLVKSIKGRDINCYYLVLAARDNLVLVVDGRKRSVEKPKRKNRLHLQATGKVAADLAQRLAAGESIRDEEIRENLTGFLQSPQG